MEKKQWLLAAGLGLLAVAFVAYYNRSYLPDSLRSGMCPDLTGICKCKSHCEDKTDAAEATTGAGGSCECAKWRDRHRQCEKRSDGPSLRRRDKFCHHGRHEATAHSEPHALHEKEEKEEVKSPPKPEPSPDRRPPWPRMRLEDTRVLTFVRGELTDGPEPRQQLRRVGGDWLGDDDDEPGVVVCHNRGLLQRHHWAARHIQWDCHAKMDPYFKLSNVQVKCQSADDSADKESANSGACLHSVNSGNVVKGSCWLEYDLDHHDCECQQDEDEDEEEEKQTRACKPGGWFRRLRNLVRYAFAKTFCFLRALYRWLCWIGSFLPLVVLLGLVVATLYGCCRKQLWQVAKETESEKEVCWPSPPCSVSSTPSPVEIPDSVCPTVQPQEHHHHHHHHHHHPSSTSATTNSCRINNASCPAATCPSPATTPARLNHSAPAAIDRCEDEQDLVAASAPTIDGCVEQQQKQQQHPLADRLELEAPSSLSSQPKTLTCQRHSATRARTTRTTTTTSTPRSGEACYEVHLGGSRRRRRDQHEDKGEAAAAAVVGGVGASAAHMVKVAEDEDDGCCSDRRRRRRHRRPQSGSRPEL